MDRPPGGHIRPWPERQREDRRSERQRQEDEHQEIYAQLSEPNPFLPRDIYD